MKTKILGLVFVCVLLLVTVIPAGAVTDGALDGNNHPYVGLMVAKDAIWRTLVALQRHADFADCIPDCGALHGVAGSDRNDLVRGRRTIFRL